MRKLSICIIFTILLIGCSSENVIEQDNILQQLESEIDEKNTIILEKDNEINEKNAIILKKDDEINKLKSDYDKLKKETVITEIKDNHYHWFEYKEPYLYLIKNVNTYNDWHSELWRYKGNRDSILLFKGKGIDYRVGSNNEMVAIESENQLLFLDVNGNELNYLLRMI